MRISITILFFAVVALLTSASQAATTTVGPAGCDYTCIQAAIDAAGPGDTVEVQSGTYRENINVNKPINLKGIGMPVVDAGGVGNAITLRADGITLVGFVASNASNGSRSQFGIGIKIISSNNTIENNNASGNCYGICLTSSSNNTLKNNRMSDNLYNFGADGYNDIDTSNLVDGKPVYYLVGESDRVIDSSSDAGIVYCKDCENITVIDLTLKNNSYGIRFDTTFNSRIKNNSVADNDDDVICLNLSSNNTVEGNNVYCNNYDGIHLYSSSNNTIEGNNVRDNSNGIYLFLSNNNTVEGNNATSNRANGISLTLSNNNTIEDNNATDNGWNGICLEKSGENTMRYNLMSGNRRNFKDDGHNDVNTSNLVDGRPVYYLVGASDRIIDSSSNAGVVCCIDCENITVRGLTLKNNSYGIRFDNTSNSRIENNNIIDNSNYGIGLSSSSNNTIEGNSVNSNNYGIDLEQSKNNIIMGNSAFGNRWNNIGLNSSSNNTIEDNDVSEGDFEGISLFLSSNNTIRGNNASCSDYNCIYLSLSNNNIVEGNNANGNCLTSPSDGAIWKNDATGSFYGIRLFLSSNNIIRGNDASCNNYNGIDLEKCSNNTVKGNNAIGNNDTGIYLLSSKDNIISMNKLVNNKENNARDDGVNRWDYETIGNYYGDFDCADSDGDGICDSAHEIPGGESVDRYPLAWWPMKRA